MKCLQRVLLAAILLMFGHAPCAASPPISPKSRRTPRPIASGSSTPPRASIRSSIDSSVTESGEAEQAGRFAEAAAKLKQAIGLGREDAAGWWKLSELEEKRGLRRGRRQRRLPRRAIAYGEQRGQALIGSPAARQGQPHGSGDRQPMSQGLRDTWDSDANTRLEQLRQSAGLPSGEQPPGNGRRDAARLHRVQGHAPGARADPLSGLCEDRPQVDAQLSRSPMAASRSASPASPSAPITG